MSCPAQHRDQVLLYLAGMLDETQQRKLEEHLDTNCPNCAACLAEAEATLANLAMALPPDKPSPDARERLMARVQQERQKAVQAVKTPSAPEPAETLTVRTAKRPLIIRLLPTIAVAAAVAAVTAAVLIVPLNAHRQQIAALEQRLQEADETVSRQASTLDHMSEAIQGSTRLFDSLYASAAQFISFTSDEEGYTEAVARMLWDRDRNVCHFFVRSLQPADEGKSYHLLLLTDDDRVVRAGRFEPDIDGGTHFQFELPNGVKTFTRAGVSYAETEEKDMADLTNAVVLEGALSR